MYIRKGELELRAVEEQELKSFRNLLFSSRCVGGMSGDLCRENLQDMEALVFAAGSGNLPPGRLMTVWQEKKGIPLGFLIIEEMDWKNGVMEVGILPGEEAESDMAVALKALTDFGFKEMRAECVMVRCVADDGAVGRICHIAGFSQDVVLRSRIVRNGVRKDVAVYTCIKGDGGV